MMISTGWFFWKPVADLNVINARLQPVADALVVLYENDHRVMEAETDLSGHVTLPVEEGHQYSVHIKGWLYGICS